MLSHQSWYQRILSRLKSRTPFYRTLSALRDENALLTTYSSDTVYRLRYDTMCYDYISPAVARLLGFTPDEMSRINFRSLILQSKMIDGEFKDVESFNPWELKRKAGQTTRWQADYLMLTKDGRHIWVTDISYPWYDIQGNIIGSVGSLRDVTQRVLAEQRTNEKINHLVHTDLATGLANRACFFNYVDQGLQHIRKNNDHFSILLIDVDGLKTVNDHYGYKIGDQLLLEMSHIIRRCLRKEDVLARTSGGEFAIFMPDMHEDGAYWAGEQICIEIAKHPFLETQVAPPVHCTVSIGVASTQDNRLITAADLYKQADNRLYVAKHTGRNQVSLAQVEHVH